MTKKLSSILELIFLGPIIKQPVSLSLIIEFKSAAIFLKVRSSKLLAKVKRVNGLYSSAVILNLLKGNINLSKFHLQF